MKRWDRRCVDDPVPTTSLIEQLGGPGVIRSGHEFRFVR